MPNSATGTVTRPPVVQPTPEWPRGTPSSAERETATRHHIGSQDQDHVAGLGHERGGGGLEVARSRVGQQPGEAAEEDTPGLAGLPVHLVDLECDEVPCRRLGDETAPDTEVYLPFVDAEVHRDDDRRLLGIPFDGESEPADLAFLCRDGQEAEAFGPRENGRPSAVDPHASTLPRRTRPSQRRLVRSAGEREGADRPQWLVRQSGGNQGGVTLVCVVRAPGGDRAAGHVRPDVER